MSKQYLKFGSLFMRVAFYYMYFIKFSLYICVVIVSDYACALVRFSRVLFLDFCRSPFKTCPALHSRLCKAAFLFRFRKLCENIGDTNLLGQCHNYFIAKQLATEYQQVYSQLMLLHRSFAITIIVF